MFPLLLCKIRVWPLHAQNVSRDLYRVNCFMVRSLKKQISYSWGAKNLILNVLITMPRSTTTTTTTSTTLSYYTTQAESILLIRSSKGGVNPLKKFFIEQKTFSLEKIVFAGKIAVLPAGKIAVLPAKSESFIASHHRYGWLFFVLPAFAGNIRRLPAKSESFIASPLFLSLPAFAGNIRRLPAKLLSFVASHYKYWWIFFVFAGFCRKH